MKMDVKCFVLASCMLDIHYYCVANVSFAYNMSTKMYYYSNIRTSQMFCSKLFLSCFYFCFSSKSPTDFKIEHVL